MSAEPIETNPELTERLTRRHLLTGWIGLCFFLLLGIVLETLHGLKADAYLGPSNATRRLMWTLAHAHGTLFALVNIAFAVSLPAFRTRPRPLVRVASWGLLAGMVVLPVGFFLGGCWLFGGDPGPGVFLVPLGALFMLGGVGAVALALWKDRGKLTDQTNPTKRSEPPPKQAEAGNLRGKSSKK